MVEKGRRYNKNKNRVELIPTFAKNQLADVYTKGAHKYSIYRDKFGTDILGKDIPFKERSNYELIDDASDNWRKGLPWMETIGSVERHIESWKTGEDFDLELNTYHLANAAWGLFTLLEFYKTYPQGDNRLHAYLNRKKIGLDIDDTINSFIPHWCKTHDCEIPHNWYFDREMREKLEKMPKEFWLSIPVKIHPKDIPFTPTCFITARSIPEEWTREWLDMHHFPHVPLYSVGVGQSKLEACKKENLDYFIDDNFDTFIELNKNGICTFLMDASHNKRHDVGYKKISDLNDFFKRFLK